MLARGRRPHPQAQLASPHDQDRRDACPEGQGKVWGEKMAGPGIGLGALAEGSKNDLIGASVFTSALLKHLAPYIKDVFI
jgi:hypothetical protein